MSKRPRGDGGDDGSWSVRYSVSTSGIPNYDAERDANVPFTKTDKFRKHMREIRADALQSTSPKLLRSKSTGVNVRDLEGVAPPSSMRPMDALLLGTSTPQNGTRKSGSAPGAGRLGSPALLKGLPGSSTNNANLRGPRSTSTANGGLTLQGDQMTQSTYGREDTVAPEKELEVLKAILLREGYLTRVAEVASSKEAIRSVPPALPDLLDLLRISSVEVVEVIAQWRQAQGKQIPFDWNGINYLLKMPSDLDFLSTCRPLVSWLGFDLQRNPFAVPLPMELYRGEVEMTKTASGVDGFTGIGMPGNVTMKAQQSDHHDKLVGGGTTTKQQLTDTVRKGSTMLEGRPYATAVVNDQTIMPPVTASQGNKNSGNGEKPGGDAAVKNTGFGRASELASSQILDVDMLRVREAEKLLLSEESRRGQWTRAPDNSGRIVPASQAEADLFLKDMGLDDLRPAVDPAYSTGNAPYAETGGMGLAKRDINGFIIEAPPLRSNEDKKRLEEMADTKKRGGVMPGQAPGGGGGGGGDGGSGPSNIPGRAKGKRTGGELAGLTVASTMGRRKAPVRRSRGARLDEELIRSRKEVNRLEDELNRLGATLAQAEHELAEYSTANQEEDESKEVAAQMIQQNARGKAGRERAAELKRRRDAVEEMQAECARRKEEVAARQRELKFKEEQHIYYKQHQKREQDRKRAAALERKRRLLDEGEVLPEDEENAVTLEDVSAAAIQRIARGRSARHYAKALKESYAHAATIIEAGARGMFHRRVVRLMRRKIKSVIRVQCQVRGMIGRIYADRLADKREQNRSASTIARIYRGLAGRIRHARKRMLFEASKGAALVVDVTHLYPADMMELSEAIAKPLVDATVPFPPPAVLGLIRIVVCILQCEKRGDTVTAFNSIGVKAARKLKATTLGWEDAMRVLRRCHKLLRQLRLLSAGPASCRPRLLHLPHEALELMAAYGDDPIMTVSNMRRIGSGAKAASHLLAWVKDLVTVHELQRHFLDEIGDVLPGWVNRQRNRHKNRRSIMLKIAIYDRATTVASNCVQSSKTAGEAWGGPQGIKEEFEVLLKQYKTDLTEIDNKELFIRGKEEAEEKRNHEVDIEAVRFAARDLEVKKSEYAEKKEKAERGGKAEELLLPSLLSSIQSATVILSEMETRLRLSKIRQTKDQLKRREWFEQPHEVRFKAAQLGEAEALFKVATVERAQEVQRIGGELYLKSLKGKAAGIMTIHDTRIQAAQTRLKECEEKLYITNKQFEKELELLFEEERRKEAEPGDWANAAQEEIEEDTREDELQALEEAERSRFFVPKHLLEIVPTRPRPLLVCISRDVSDSAKKAMMKYLCSELPGMFVQVSSIENHGVDIDAFQRVLSTGQSVLCEVDVGISETQRGCFLSALSVAKRALVPSPYAVLAMGDVRNRRGSIGDEYLGCSEYDLRFMKDGLLKRRLECAAEAIHSLSSSQKALDQIQYLSTLGEPPSRAHASVLEAAIILLTPTNRFRGPSDGVAGMAWAACRLVLADPIEFVQRLREVDPCNIPAANLDVIRMYIGKHPTELSFQSSSHPNMQVSSSSSVARRSSSVGGGGGGLSGGGFVPMGGSGVNGGQGGFSAWPNSSSPQRDSSQYPVMAHLIEWVEAATAFAYELANKGGSAKPVTKRYPRGLFAAVIPVRDATTKSGEYDEMSLRGWSAASVSLLAPILEDMRVHREAIKLNGTLHSVNVYRDCHRIFFSAYDPVSSLYRAASTAVSRVNQLLAPNSVESSEFASKGAPTTPEALYRRLVELLSIESVRNVTTGLPVKRMVCRRKLTLLLRETRKISGHMATITVYEEAKGELRSHVYLPEFCAAIELNCGGKTLSKLFPNADDNWEKPHLASQEALRLLGPITDRLEVHPSKREISEMGLKPKAKVGANPSDAPQASRHQGFSLTLRPKGGPGRMVFKKLCNISGVQHLITVREFGRGGLLRVRVYEPLSSVEREIRLSPTQRIALLGSDTSDDWRSWYKQLEKRLSLKRRAGGAFGLHLSKLLCRSAVRINRGVNTNDGEASNGMLVAVVIYLDDGDGSGNALRIACQRPNSQEEFSFLLSNSEIGDLLKCREISNPIKDVLCNHKNVKHKRACFEKLLSALSYDEEEDEVLLATPGSVRAEVNYVTDEDTGLSIPIVSIKKTSLASSPDAWVKRNKPLLRPLVLEETPPPPTEGFGLLRPLPLRGGSVDEVGKSRKQPPIVKYEHVPTESGSYKYEPPSPELTMEEALDIATTGSGSVNGGGGLSSAHSQNLDKTDQLQDGSSEGYRRVSIDVSETLVPSVNLQNKIDAGGESKDLANLDNNGDGSGVQTLPVEDEGSIILRNQKPAEGNSSKKLALLLAPEQDNALNSREGERCVFNQAVKVHMGEVPELSFESTMIVKVFEFFNHGMEAVQRSLRFAVYDPSTSTVEDVVIAGDVELRETVGPHAQHLFDPTANAEREAALYYHIARWRSTIVKGLWNDERDCYELDGDRFTIVLKKERLYSIDKQTPLHSSGGMASPGGTQPIGRDGTANMDKLIDDATKRGIKILRQGLAVDGVLMHLTVFELSDEMKPIRESKSMRSFKQNSKEENTKENDDEDKEDEEKEEENDENDETKSKDSDISEYKPNMNKNKIGDDDDDEEDDDDDDEEEVSIQTKTNDEMEDDGFD
mmetsp:Transcript_33621/g.39521  ORF Transcript_33621/g.39521 Transcript_33621/m.39521 type:complete len:2664 (+) Transcript_33621:57-8048(+)